MQSTCLSLFVSVSMSVFLLFPWHGSANQDGTGRDAIIPKIDFQIFVLAQSSQAAFCQGHYRKFPGCKAPESYWKTHFTLHGLWPQYDDQHADPRHPYPHDCQGQSFDPSVIEAIGLEEMVKYWPDVRYNPSDKRYDEFWEHEWIKHGTCSGLPQFNYTKEALQLIEKHDTPQIIQENVGRRVSRQKVIAAFGGKEFVSLQCKGEDSHLYQFYTCWEAVPPTSKPQLKGDSLQKSLRTNLQTLSEELSEISHANFETSLSLIPGKRVRCPDSVLKEATCDNEEIPIPSFPTTADSREEDGGVDVVPYVAIMR